MNPNDPYGQNTVPGQYNQQPPNYSQPGQFGPPYGQPPPPVKWYRTTGGTIALLIFFFPVGLYLMWRYMNWPKNVKWIVTGAIVVIGLCGSINNAISSSQYAAQQAATPTQQPMATLVPTSMLKPTLIPTSVPTISTQSVISPTNGRPHLGGPVSDFYGKYGQPVGDARPDSTGWFFNDNNDDLIVHYDANSRIVNYITYAGSSSWSKEQYKNYLLTFAPDDAVENVDANTWWKSQGGDPYDPIAYTSSSIGKFFLHISDGSGWANIV